MTRMTEDDLGAKLGWEGYEYALTDMSPEEMPTEAISALLAKAQDGVKELFDYFEGLEYEDT